jgi:hypothetical protein
VLLRGRHCNTCPSLVLDQTKPRGNKDFGKAARLDSAFPFRYLSSVDYPEGSREARPIRWRGKDGFYDVTLRFAPIEGRMECVGIDVQPVPGPRTLTAVALHSLPLGKLIEKRRKEAGDVVVTVDTVGAIAWVGQPVVVTVTRRGGRPPKYGPEHWQEVARIYREAYEHSKNRTPTRAVARHFRVSDTAAAKWVAKCRHLGLLPKTTRGKPRAVVQAPAIGRTRARSQAKGRAVSATPRSVMEVRRRAASSLPRRARGGKK